MKDSSRGISLGGLAILVLGCAMAVPAIAVEVKVAVPQVHIPQPPHPVTPQLHAVTPMLKGNVNSSKGLQQNNSSNTSTAGGATFEESKRKTGSKGIAVTKQLETASPALEKAVEAGALQGTQPLNGSQPGNSTGGGYTGGNNTGGGGGIVVTKQVDSTSPTLEKAVEGGALGQGAQPVNGPQPGNSTGGSNPGGSNADGGGIVVTKELGLASPTLLQKAP